MKIVLRAEAHPAGEFTAPSGTKFYESDFNFFKTLHSVGFITREKQKVRLNSGTLSNFYVHGREDLTDNPDVLLMVGMRLAHQVDTLPLAQGTRYCVIGIPEAATKLAQAASAADSGEHHSRAPMCFRTMRSEQKSHGLHGKWVEGRPDYEQHSYVTIENALTSGAGVLRALDRMEEDEYTRNRMHHLIMVDREHDGIAALLNADVERKRIHVMWKFRDIVALFVHLGLWPQSHYEELEAELAAFRRNL